MPEGRIEKKALTTKNTTRIPIEIATEIGLPPPLEKGSRAKVPREQKKNKKREEKEILPRRRRGAETGGK